MFFSLKTFNLNLINYLNKGKNAKAYGPGYIRLLDPAPEGSRNPENYIDDIKKKVDMREKCHTMQNLECRTSDNIDINVQGICFYEIFDPIKGVLSCEGQDVDKFIATRASSLLRDAVESHNLITVLRKKQDLQNKMRVRNLFLLFVIFEFVFKYFY